MSHKAQSYFCRPECERNMLAPEFLHHFIYYVLLRHKRQYWRVLARSAAAWRRTRARRLALACSNTLRRFHRRCASCANYFTHAAANYCLGFVLACPVL